jgi:hypothetical protein
MLGVGRWVFGWPQKAQKTQKRLVIDVPSVANSLRLMECPSLAGFMRERASAIQIMTAAIGIQIGIGTEIDEKVRNSTPIAIAISISTVRMCHN